MTVLDWIILAVIGFFLIRGLFRGFLVELFGLLAIGAGYVAARFGGPVLASWLESATPLNRWFAGIASAIVLFVVASILVMAIARLFRRVAKAAQLGGVDRTFGAVFGSVKALFIALAVLLLASLSPWHKPIGDYAMRGKLSSWMWVGSQIVRDAVKAEPVEQSRVMASVLRSLGMNEEIVHIITDQPDLMPQVMKKLKEADIKLLPVDKILKGEPQFKMPKNIHMPDVEQTKIVTMFENMELSASEKAEAFVEKLKEAQKQI